MRVAYADPPYPGQAKRHYGKDGDPFEGDVQEVDHAALVARLCADFDAWALHTASVTLAEVLAVCPPDVRIGAWVKTFASYKPGVNPAYAWEPVIFHGGRNDSSRQALTVPDWIAHPITLRKGLTGAKPPNVVRWVFHLLGLEPGDELEDLFPGTGIVGETWRSWQTQPELPLVAC